MWFITFAILVGVIAIVTYVARHPYKSEPIKYVSDVDLTDSRYCCQIHKFYFAHLDTVCPMCQGEYHNDVYAGVFPPGISESNKQFYYVEDWIALRKIDIKWHDGEITEQEAIRRRNEYIRSTIPKRIAVATSTDPDVQRAKMEVNMKRRNNYAGSAQYSGITPK